MDLYSLITEHKYLLDIFYTFLISFICAIIVLKTDRFFRLSLHQGIRYFRNAFFFFGLGFILRYFFGLASDLSVWYSSLLGISFEYVLVMAGFFLFYSLIWKNFELTERRYFSSLFNQRIIIFHILALVIALLDFLFSIYYFMFISQIIIFLCASSIAYINLKRSNGKHPFLKFYFFSMLLVFSAWVLNFLAAFLFDWNSFILINIGIINVIFFLLSLYGILKATQKK